MSIDDIYAAQAKIKQSCSEKPFAYTRSQKELTQGLLNAGVDIYPCQSVAEQPTYVGSLYGIEIYTDECLPPGVIEMRDRQWRILQTFRL